MGIIGAMKNVVQMWRNFVSSIQACCQWVYSHFIFLLAICILFVVCKFFPSVLSLLISCSPILICTFVLLNTLLSFGSTNNAPAEEKTIKETSVNTRVVEKHEKNPSENRLKRRNNIRERALEKSGFPIEGSSLSSKEKKVGFSSIPPYGGLMRRKARMEEQPIRETARESSKKEVENPDDAESSDFGSDKAECSSPNTPPANVLPVIDEIDPLLDSKVPQLPIITPDEFDAVLESSDRSIDGSVDSEAENQEETQGNEEQGGNKSFVAWTEDDEKNLMDLGTSELERNQRLENLIARRRARKSFVKVAEKNLIDFDSNEPTVQIPSISTMKSNPFDVPFMSSGIDGLPPIPGSAPSVLVPRGNPFDLPYDSQEEKPNLTEDSFQQEFMSVFCRHESFSLGPSYMTGLKQDKYNTKYTPYFRVEGTASQRFESSGSRGQSSERRNSVWGSGLDSESLPPIDRKNRRKQMERVLSLGVYPPSYPLQERQISEVNFTKPYHELKRDANVNKVETKNEALMEPEVVKESSVSSSSEINEEVVDVNIEEEKSQNVEPTATGVFNKEPSLPLEESDLNERVMEGVDDGDTKEPVYDSSPSAVEKRTIDEYLVYSDKGPVLTSTFSIASDMQVEVSETGSPRESLDRYPYANGESSVHEGVAKNTIEPRDNAVEENEVRPTELTEQPANNAPPSSVGPEMHGEFYQHDVVVVDSMAPSPSSDLDKGEPLRDELTVRPSSGRDHIEESQEASLKSIEDDNKDNKNIEGDDTNVGHPPKPVEATMANVEETNGLHETTEDVINPAKLIEGTMADVEASRSHETTDNNMDVEESTEVHETLVNPSKPMDATTVDAEASEVHETTNNNMDAEESSGIHIEDPVEATTVEAEASRVQETTDNNMELQNGHDEEVGEHMELKNDEKLEKENEIECDKIEVPNQDRNS